MMIEKRKNGLLRHIPNAITVARIAAIPYTVWLIDSDNFDIAFWIFVAAGISDGIDGYLAKILDARSKLGAFLDPLADKALLLSVFISLVLIGAIPAWFAVLVVGRDLVVLAGAGAFRLKTGSLVIAPLLIGKVNTVAQVVTAGAFLGSMGFSLEVDSYLDIMVAITAATTVGSGAIYMAKWSKMAFGGKGTA